MLVSVALKFTERAFSSHNNRTSLRRRSGHARPNNLRLK